jgi:tetratricopeptide (TPR) repeat protein
MKIVMTRHASSMALAGCLSLGVGTAAAQSAGPVPVPRLPMLAPVPPSPPSPPSPPAPFWFDFKLNQDDLQFDLDLDAIREDARQAVETARVATSFAGREDRVDVLYRQARQSIDQGRYERAIEQLDRLVNMAGSDRVDAALYWKSYTLAKQGRRPDALTTLADLQKRFADSRWLKDAKALEVEIRQASGQAVSPDAQNDEELKLLALRGLMQSDPDRAVPMIERLLAGNSSVKLQENALFVLSQSRSSRAREIITTVARSGNPDLQVRAIRYLGAMGGPENRQILDEVYRASSDTAVKRAILRSLFLQQNAATLVDLAREEKDAALRKEIVTKLSLMKSKEATDYFLELLK